MKNKILISLVIKGPLLIIMGAYLKINAIPLGETLLGVGMVWQFVLIGGLIYFNSSKAKKNIV